MRISNPTLLAPLAALVLSGALSGCVSLSPDLPESMLVLTPTAQAPAGSGGAATAAEAIAVLEPEAPAKLNVLRVPVQVDGSNIAYLKDALWVEKPARLFRRLVAETIRVKSGKMVVDGDEPGLAADTRLRGTLLDFGYDAQAMAVVVRFDAVRVAKDGAVTTRRFESVVPGVSAEAGPVGNALNEAANEVAGQVADWVSGA
ncbi:MAG: membrane integrity-associated transporter subunit PqiC [Sphingomonadaceae bacterium]|nr:membrane integrity-associated transporter subunit PqiC [Sphingomonadaceae bacterium]